MRFFVALCMTLVALLLPFWCFCVGALLYTFWRPAYELLLIGVCIDAQFGIGYYNVSYLYTATAGGLLLLSAFVKPLLMVYDR